MQGIVRPTESGYSVVYRTRMLRMATGSVCVRMPGWRVQEGDRLFARTDTPCLAAQGTASVMPGHVTFPASDPWTLRAIPSSEVATSSEILALRAIQPEAARTMAEPQQDP